MINKPTGDTGTTPLTDLPTNRLGWIERTVIAALVSLLAISGYFLFAQFKNYTYLSPEHVADLIRARLWSLGWLGLSVFALYLLRRRAIAPVAAVFAVSAYFLIQYGYLFRGTEYGMNGHWGDNGNRLAEICKMMAYGSFFQDWYLKDLPSFYPPGWFALMAVYAKVIGIEAYQTVKWGYFLIFLVYPWLLYFSWRKLVSPTVSAAITIVILFLGYRYMDWIYYESISAGLFIPWWFYYVERGIASDSENRLLTWREYVVGSTIGGCLFMTYYYWFLVVVVATPFLFVARYLQTRSKQALLQDAKHKLIIAGGVVLVSAVYWAPLLRVIRRFGAESMQHLWFVARHMDLTHQWTSVSVEGMLIFAGLFCAFFFWKSMGNGKLVYFYLGGFLVIVLDRILNMNHESLQSRKILEFVHLFAMIPLGAAVIDLWTRLEVRTNMRRGLLGVGLLLLVVTSNGHTENSEGDFYRMAVGQRVPQGDLVPFKAVETRDKVFLTQSYIESVYLPYYLFIPLNNMTAHTAGRYSQRELFIQQTVKIVEPELLAYVLRHNRYSAIDYVYLPVDTATGRVKISLYQAGFNKVAAPVIYRFQCDLKSGPGSFVLKHARGVYEVQAPAGSREMDEQIRAKYSDIFWHLEPTTSSQ
jgi:hypothetical protein